MLVKGAPFLFLLLLACGSSVAKAPTGAHPASVEDTASAAPRTTQAPRPRASASDEEHIPKVVEGLNRFALDLYRDAPKAGNALLSPLSVAAALSLTELGARGESADALHQLLGASPASEYRVGLRGLLARLMASAPTKASSEFLDEDEAPPYTLNLASSIWVQANYPVVSEFVTTAKKLYAASVHTFESSRSENAAAAANDWVAHVTNSQLTDAIGAEDITPLMRVLLVSAVHFRGSWSYPFWKHSTANRPFHLEGVEEPVMVPTMWVAEPFRFAQNEDVSILQLSYSSQAPNTSFAMNVIIPRPGHTLAEIESKLDEKQLAAWTENIPYEQLRLWLPKWETQGSWNLRKPLSNLGLGQLFTGSADLSGISKASGLYLDSVLHKTSIAVDETGTEASAATTVTHPCGEPPPPIDVQVDRPFLYLIRDTRSGVILFIGRVTDPRKSA